MEALSFSEFINSNITQTFLGTLIEGPEFQNHFKHLNRISILFDFGVMRPEDTFFLSAILDALNSISLSIDGSELNVVQKSFLRSMADRVSSNARNFFV